MLSTYVKSSKKEPLFAKIDIFPNGSQNLTPSKNKRIWFIDKALPKHFHLKNDVLLIISIITYYLFNKAEEPPNSLKNIAENPVSKENSRLLFPFTSQFENKKQTLKTT